MKTTLVPGYKEIYGQSAVETYDDIIALLPSALVIHLCIILNGELYTPEDDKVTQKRLINMVGYRFTPEQNRILNLGFEGYRKKTGGHFSDVVFGRRYLMAMILKELNNYREVDHAEDRSALQEFHFFKAYLLVIDEVNKNDNIVFDAVKLDKNDPVSQYKLLWTTNINQFEFSDHTNIIYETFKLIAFLNYAKQQLKPYLKVFLSDLGFSTMGQLLSSMNQVATSADQYYPKEVFKMLTYIAPDENIDQKHLRSQLISQVIGRKAPITLFDIKKYPLYFYAPKGYMVIDSNIYKKKTYLGPFFDLCKNTDLEKDKGFNAYSGDISYHVLELSCLKTVLKNLQDLQKGLIYFDDETESIPDGYYREKETIFLFEFKANLLPFEYSSEPKFEKIKDFIDSRLVKSDKKKPKGIGQLKQQIEFLADGTFTFDDDLKKAESRKRIKIYPIICHTEFHFGLPGVNHYLEDLFRKSLSPELEKRYDIRPLTVINLEVLFDYGVRVHYYKHLGELIERYHRILKDRIKKLPAKLNQETYWRAHMSFDELYHSLYIKEINNAPQRRLDFEKILASMDIHQDDLDEPIL
jgi:hypothetical protein